MDPFHFSCPHCFSRLRVRDPLSVGREVDCPECGRYLLVIEGTDNEGRRELRVTTATEPTPLKIDADQPVRAPSPDKTSSHEVLAQAPAEGTGKTNVASVRSGRRAKREIPAAAGALPIRQAAWWRRPVVMAWSITGICAAALFGYVFLIADSSSLTNPPASDPAAERASALADVETGEKPVIAGRTDTSDDTQTRQRMTELGTVLLDSLDADAAFPSATSRAPQLAPHRRLSWQATLADRFTDGHPPVAWDHAWNDPLNDPFVRRRLHPFQNPAIRSLTGEDGYPATHFVGVAGIGEDATSLAASDPRAGIFGDNRQTRLTDIRDGASNTWLVLGVREHLGSWAAGGRSTVRSLTREPYVNGPDGFGTGAADSMLALLADGSVRVVNAATDPRLLRSLAAMSDGPSIESADSQVADRTAKLPAIGTLVPRTSDTEERDIQPLEPELAPDPIQKKIDLALSLRQPILLYDLPRSRPLYEWLPGVADMIGAPIRFDDAELGSAIGGLKTPVRLRLENTTVGEILESLLQPAGLTYRVEIDHIRLSPRQ